METDAAQRLPVDFHPLQTRVALALPFIKSWASLKF
jgi:hypothetical protein